MEPAFEQQTKEGCAPPEPSATLGFPFHDTETLQGVPRAGGAVDAQSPRAGRRRDGTGKTKTLQVLAGQLSDAGIPLFVADVKGDLTGVKAPTRASSGGVDVGDVVKAGTKFATSREGQRLIRSVLGTLFKGKG